jgi:hypothetical protein
MARDDDMERDSELHYTATVIPAPDTDLTLHPKQFFHPQVTWLPVNYFDRRKGREL